MKCATPIATHFIVEADATTETGLTLSLPCIQKLAPLALSCRFFAALAHVSDILWALSNEALCKWLQ
jgi:hypothetical protein